MIRPPTDLVNNNDDAPLADNRPLVTGLGGDLVLVFYFQLHIRQYIVWDLHGPVVHNR